MHLTYLEWIQLLDLLINLGMLIVAIVALHMQNKKK